MKTKKVSKKVVYSAIAIAILLNVFVYSITTVFANTGTPKLVLQTNNDITISIDSEDSNKLLYKQGVTTIGTVKVKLYNNDGSYVTPSINNGNAEFELPECQGDGYQVKVEITPEEGYGRSSNYSFKGIQEPVPGDNIVNLSIIDNSVQTMYFEFSQGGVPGPNESEHSIAKMDFTINGESFTDVVFDENNITIDVSESFNVDELTEFYVTRIELENQDVFEYDPGEYSLDLLDNQDRRILESHFDKVSTNMVRFRVESHSNDILEEDIAEGKTRDDYLGFYITNIDFVKEGFKGVEIYTSVMPDNYDFTSWNGVDLSDTTESNPGNITVYYGEDTINFGSMMPSPISEINLVEDGTVPTDAVEINSQLGQVRILSNYYNNIPLQIELSDGTVGFVNVTRIGIFINDINAGSDTFYHGASAIVSGNFDVETDKNRIGATFYHDNNTTYEDYDLIVNMTYEDGSNEIYVATGVGDVDNSYGNIIGSDYLLWKDEGGKRPLKVNVTAVKKDALDDSNTFGGATFGSGAGIEWEYRR